jgi:hypothetical protein
VHILLPNFHSLLQGDEGKFTFLRNCLISAKLESLAIGTHGMAVMIFQKTCGLPLFSACCLSVIIPSSPCQPCRMKLLIGAVWQKHPAKGVAVFHQSRGYRIMINDDGISFHEASTLGIRVWEGRFFLLFRHRTTLPTTGGPEFMKGMLTSKGD